MTHDLPTTTINGKEYVLINTNSKASNCFGCCFDRANSGCVELVRSTAIHCHDRLIYIPNTPKDIADHIAQRLEST